LPAQEQFGEALRRAREAAGMSQQEVGNLCDMDPTAVSRLERGQRNPRLDTIVRLARAVRVPPAKLLEDVK
jgi:transcriptional regulator with XRE-family HTH domain